MANARRGYIYLACLVSLEAVTWAVISLLRNLLTSPKYTSLEGTAFQIAIIIVGLPLFVVHWLWAQRLARRDAEERGAVLRRLYLYGVMATFLSPFLANTFDLLERLLRLADDLLRLGIGHPFAFSRRFTIAHHLAAMAVLALLWFYHWRVVQHDSREIPEEGGAATVRRLYVYGFGAAGLAMTTLAAVYLARWLMFQFGSGTIVTRQADLIREVARLAVGLPLWLIFWSWAQRLFAAPDEEERNTVLRKVYLYAIVFLSVLATVTTLTIVLADGLGRLLGVSPSSGDVREALAVLLGAGLVWTYHAYVLRRDAALAGEPATTAWVRQLYHYLVAAIGLGALLTGLAGDLTLLIQALAEVSFVRDVPEMAAWFTALILAGLPVWLLPWRQVQLAATAPGPTGDEESRSVIRKIYLYFYLLLATLTVLGSGVYLVSRLVGLVLGVRQSGNLLAELGQALAYSVMAVGIWLYHGSVLRADGRRVGAVRAARLSSLRVAVLNTGDESLDHTLLDELRRELPGLGLQVLDTSAADTPAALTQADLIVGPWLAAITGDEVAQAIAACPVPKILLPIPAEGWHWAGTSEVKPQEAVRQAMRAVKQFAAGEEIQAKQGLSAGAIMAIVVSSVLLLAGLVIPLLAYFALANSSY